MANSSSDEETDVSDSEIYDYIEKPLEELKAGIYEVKRSNGTLRCPFCVNKKKQVYIYKDLLQHATGVSSTASARRSGREKANHLALAEYLESELTGMAEPQPSLVSAPLAVDNFEQSELYCWPWMGIVMNIIGEPDSGIDSDSTAYWLKRRFSKHKPVEVKIFWDDQHQTAVAVVKFNHDWTGFRNGIRFEKLFETDRHSKKEWNAQISSPGPGVYGWLARDDDYGSEGPIGEYLRAESELKSIGDLVEQASKARDDQVASLTNLIDLKNENLDQLTMRYSEMAVSVGRMLKEKEDLHHAFCEETRSVQQLGLENVERVLDEQEKLNSELDSKKKKLESWSKELNRRETLTKDDSPKLDEEKKKNDSRNTQLQLASDEQRTAEEDVLRLVEEHKREKEEALKHILELERDLHAKQTLELEIEELKGKLKREEEEAAKKILESESDLTAKQKLELEIEELKGLLKVMEIEDHSGDDDAAVENVATLLASASII